MKVLLLLIWLHRPDFAESPFLEERLIVNSLEQAAVIIWQKNNPPTLFQSYSGDIYEIDLKNLTIKVLKIPSLSFDNKENK